VHKARHREIGSWLARHVGRPAAVYGTWLAVRVGITANQVTIAALMASAAAVVALATGTRAGFVAGVALAHFSFWLDHVDGQVARWRGTASLTGVYLDYLMHHATTLGLAFGLGYGLAERSGDLHWVAAGFASALGLAGLSLHNDCRYKAFFQRLKRERRTFRVDGGAGGKPAPAAPWPRRGLGAITWPLLKACEPHSLLVELAFLAALSLLYPPAWLWLWRNGVRLLAVLAPALAIGRAAKALARQAVDDEFDRWFQPWSGA
jgi:phosphatidylglycerophosphate synthase